MSEINKPAELSVDELDQVAGGAVSDLLAKAKDATDSQVGLTAIGGQGNGGITNFNAQETTEFTATLKDFKATGVPGIEQK